MPENNPTPGATLEIINVDTPELEVELAEPSVEVGLEEAPAATAVTTADAATSIRKELVPVYILAMHLPSADLIAEDYTEAAGGGVRRIKEWTGNARHLAREIETMRRNIYRRLERIWCMVREFGVWISVSETGVEEAERISREVRERLRRLGLGQYSPRYFVRAVKIYLEPQDARVLLDAAVEQLRGEVDELQRRIDDAIKNQNKRLAKELMHKKEYVRELLNMFKKYIEDISR
jgi:hypothetical protein